MNKEKYEEQYEEFLYLLWHSDKEENITRQFYKDLSHLSKNIIYSKKRSFNPFEQVLRLFNGKGWGN